MVNPKLLQNDIDRLERDLSFKQLQINRLLNITQAINNNAPADDLFGEYTSILSFDMNIKKMLLMTREEQQWRFATSIEVSPSFAQLAEDEPFVQFQRMGYVEEMEDPFLREFDFVIPVYHKKEPIAIAFLGRFQTDDTMYDRVQFITTITNMITIAIENKRLFKRQLEQERLKKEMELARSVQTMLIPSALPSNAQYDLDGLYMPHSGVGGDYYDFIRLNDSEIVLCIADISGKGIPAAILMANFQANVQVLVRKHITPKKFIELLNRAVQRITKGEKFITFFIAKYHLTERKIVYINAGHNPPFLVSAEGVQPLEKGCTILGAFDEIPQVEIGELSVPPDSRLVLYTDGLTDLMDTDGNFFDEKDFHAFAQQNHAATSKNFNIELVQKLNEFRKERYYTDDVTVLNCKFF